MRPITIIAEAGVNHNGDLQLAYELIDQAAEAGVDYVKFQTFIPSRLVSVHAPKAEYQARNTGDDSSSQQSMLQQLALTFSDFKALYRYTQKKGIGFLSTGFDDESVRFIDSLGVDFHKIPSGEITNKPYLELIGSLRKPVIVSTGMATLDEVAAALEILYKQGLTNDKITLLHCTTEYPAPVSEVNLRAVETMRNTFGLPTGYSDHTAGILIPQAAAAMGACMIEKHFTLSRQLPGPDHQASLEPAELAEMVQNIRLIEQALGDGIKKPTASEIKNIAVARRSIHIVSTLPEGHVITHNDLIMKRPGTGISPMQTDAVIGKTLKTSLDQDTMLLWEHLV